MRKTVLLEHTLADSSTHGDWMLEQAEGGDPDERVLLTFHVEGRIDRVGVDSFEASRIDDHRRLYLDYEGEISGGRGRVRQLALGEILEMNCSANELVAVIDWGAGPIEYRGHSGADESSLWRFTAAHGLSR